MLKIVSIIGARPQFIKYFSLSRAMKKHKIRDILIHTGQHYDYCMSKLFFEELSLKQPDYHLGIGSLAGNRQIKKITKKIRVILSREKPCAVLVFGDTDSTYAGAIAANQSKIPLVHIEAGLRSHNRNMPEEVNRVRTDGLSSILLCPSFRSTENLKKEGFKNIANQGRLIPQNYFKKRIILGQRCPLIVNTGDIMLDGLNYFLKRIKKNNSLLKALNIKCKHYYLYTMHRQGNTDCRSNFKKIINFINKIAEDYPVIFPMHPRAKKYYKTVESKFSPKVRIIEPLGYLEALTLLFNSGMLLTDSGGMQKEAYWLGIPCVALRDETEWGETLKSGWNCLYKNYKGLPKNPGARRPVYGDGNAANRMVEILNKAFGEKE